MDIPLKLMIQITRIIVKHDKRFINSENRLFVDGDGKAQEFEITNLI